MDIHSGLELAASRAGNPPYLVLQAELFTVLTLGMSVLGVMAASALLIKRDNERGKAQVERWAQGVPPHQALFRVPYTSSFNHNTVAGTPGASLILLKYAYITTYCRGRQRYQVQALWRALAPILIMAKGSYSHVAIGLPHSHRQTSLGAMAMPHSLPRPSLPHLFLPRHVRGDAGQGGGRA